MIEKVVVDLAKRFEGRAGGYTRIVKIGERCGDSAAKAIIAHRGRRAETRRPSCFCVWYSPLTDEQSRSK